MAFNGVSVGTPETLWNASRHTEEKRMNMTQNVYVYIVLAELQDRSEEIFNVYATDESAKEAIRYEKMYTPKNEQYEHYRVERFAVCNNPRVVEHERETILSPAREMFKLLK